MTFFTGAINNFSDTSLNFSIKAQTPQNGNMLTVKGPKSIPVASGEKKEVTFALLSPVSQERLPVAVQISLCWKEDQCIQQQAFIAPLDIKEQEPK